MYLSSKVLGSAAVKTLAARQAAALLVIGTDVFHRRDLATVGCFSFTAAANLSRIVRELGAKNTREVFEKMPPSAFVVPRLGAISLAVLGAAFEAKGLGGAQPLDAWVARHQATDAAVVTFDTMKHREALREVGERRARAARRSRTSARRAVAHRLRVDRFTTRHGRASV